MERQKLIFSQKSNKMCPNGTYTGPYFASNVAREPKIVAHLWLRNQN